MLKNNKKGFFLSETMVVLAVVAVVLLSVFRLFSSVYSNFQQTEKHDTANGITALSNVQKYFESIEKIDTSMLSETTPYIDLTENSIYDSDYYERLKQEFKIDNVYLIDLNYTLNNETTMDTFYVTLRKYIKTLKNLNGIVLLVVINGNEFASIKIENFEEVTLIGNEEDEYAVYVPKNGVFIDPGYTNWTGEEPTKTWEDGKEIDTSKKGTYYLHYDFNGYVLRRKVVVGAHNGVEYINNVYSTLPTQHGLIKDNTEDENIRYAGSNEDVKNYVEFNSEPWRIIGVFDVASEEGGTKVPRIKLVRDSWFTDETGDRLGMVWDSSDSTINAGYGVNQWGEVKDAEGNITYEGADLMRLLNGYYLGKEGATCTYCNAAKQATCPTANDCSTSVTPLSSSARNMINDAEWNLGATTITAILPLENMYQGERSSQTGRICGNGSWLCNDNIVRTKIWIGRVGLIYPSDYAYASTNDTCKNDIYTVDSHCGESNWLHTDYYSYWLISPRPHSEADNFALAISANSSVFDAYVTDVYSVRPSVYLNPNVTITEGEGTETSPYKLSIN